MTGTQGYILCATPRSGSTLLCAMLRASGVAGHPESWFRAQDIDEYAKDWGIVRSDGSFDWPCYLCAARQAGAAGTPVFALRLMWVTLAHLAARLGADHVAGQAAAFEQAFGPLRHVYLRRRAVLAQAISRHKAEVSGIWHIGIEAAADPVTPHYDADRIARFLREAKAANAGWEAWFAANRIAPLRLIHEDLCVDPPATALAVLAYLRLGPVPAASLLVTNVRMADAQSADWAARFRRETGYRGP